VRQTDTQFVKAVEYSIKEGKPLLIENIGDALAPSLQDLIESYNTTLISPTKKDYMLKFDNKVHKCLSSFKLFLTTPLERPHFSVDIQNLSIMINF
jgi:dynein heavy chain